MILRNHPDLRSAASQNTDARSRPHGLHSFPCLSPVPSHFMELPYWLRYCPLSVGERMCRWLGWILLVVHGEADVADCLHSKSRTLTWPYCVQLRRHRGHVAGLWEVLAAAAFTLLSMPAYAWHRKEGRSRNHGLVNFCTTAERGKTHFFFRCLCSPTPFVQVVAAVLPSWRDSTLAV